MNQYDTFMLLEDLNPIIKKGMSGVILEIYDSEYIEVEFVNQDGSNIGYKEQFTFTINKKIIKIKTVT
jgi:hypothetical protein